MSGTHVEPEARWLGSKGFWAFLAILILAGAGLAVGRAFWLAQRTAEPAEAFLYGQPELTPGAQGAYRVLVRNARDLTPLPGAEVRARLSAPGGASAWSGQVRTDEAGFALLEPRVAATAVEGDYTLAVATDSREGRSEVTQHIAVKRSYRLMVTTDKPLYQPGQVIHLRALVLATADLKPGADLTAVLEVKDAKGNKVFKHMGRTSAYGIVFADFLLADQVNTGPYTVAAAVGDTTSERSVTVERYVLPKFKVEISTDKAFYQPGDTVKGEVVARYTFGEPVAHGRVRLSAQELLDTFREFATAQGETGPDGRFTFQIPLKEAFAGVAVKGGNALVSLEAAVVDRADHAQKRTLELPVSAQPLAVDLIPESGRLALGVENVIWVVTSYPDGRPAQARVWLHGGRPTTTDESGIGELRITPQESVEELTVEAEDRFGARAMVTRQLAATATSEGLLLRTDAPVYATGQTMRVTVLSGGSSGRVFVDVVKDSRTVLTQAADLREGRAEVALDLPADLAGTLELRAYRVLISGEILGDTRLVQVNPATELRVAVTLDKPTYRPGEKALLRFAVTRAGGLPTAAALGLSGVDEAVFALTEMRPGLERVFFMLQEEMLKPRYEIHASVPLDRTRLVAPIATPGGANRATAVVFSAAAGESVPTRQQSASFAQKQAALRDAGTRYRQNLMTVALVSPVGLLVLAALPFLAYLGVRLVRRRPVEGIEEPELRTLGRAVGAVGWSFAVGIWGVLVGIGALGITLSLAGSRLKPVWALGGLGVVVVVMALVQALAARRVRHLPAADSLPLLRKLAALTPVTFVLAPLAVVSLVVASSYPWRLQGAPLASLVAAVTAAVLIVAAALGVARACATRRVSLARYLGIALGRPLLVAAPVLLLALLALLARGGLRRGNLAAQLDGDVREIREEVMLQVAQPAAIEGGVADIKAQKAAANEKGEAEGSPLKEPSRVRRFFPETLVWIPELITGGDGRAELDLPLADSITTWRIAGSAVSAVGELGAFEQPLKVFQDFFVDLDLPVALTQHDAVSVPVAVYNYLPVAQTVQLELQRGDWFELQDEAVKTVRMGPREVGSVYFRLEARGPGRHALTVKARGTELADAVERQVTVRPDGEETVQTVNGTLEKAGQHTLTIPATAIAGASDLFVKVYPGAFSQVVEGLDSILRMPGGCFEQTSSSTYPNVLVLGYLRATKQVKPEIEMKALGFINQGYQRLLSFEVPGGGFSWFGSPPAHNVLTAYGVLEFADMARVAEVDPAVLQRTAQWLLSQQEGDGSWKPTAGGIAEGAINQYQGQVLRTTAYIAWALTEAGQAGSGLESALRYIRENASSSQDPYTLAVCANALASAKDNAARKVIDQLLALKQEADGGIFWKAVGEGVTYSRGEVLDIETTAIAAQAMLKAGQETALAHKALTWLTKNKDSFGTWESTQATIAAMRALLAGSGPAGALEKPLDVTVIANGKAASELHITPETSDVFRLVSLRELVRVGENTVVLEANGTGNLAYSIVAVHYVPWQKPRGKATEVMSIDVTYDSTLLKKDDTLTSTVTVRYNRPEEARMTIVDLGVPPGFDVLPETLDALKSSGQITRFSLAGRQVILYFDRIPGQRPISFSYQMKAKFPVRAKTPPSTVYQYYEPAARSQAAPVEITVT